MNKPLDFGGIDDGGSLVNVSGNIMAISSWKPITGYNGTFPEYTGPATSPDLTVQTNPSTISATFEKTFELSSLMGDFDPFRIQMIQVSINSQRIGGFHETLYVDAIVDGQHTFRLMNSTSATTMNLNDIATIPIFEGTRTLTIRITRAAIHDAKDNHLMVELKNVWTIATALTDPRSSAIYIAGTRSYFDSYGDGYIDRNSVLASTDEGSLATSSLTEFPSEWSDIFDTLVIPDEVARSILVAKGLWGEYQTEEIVVTIDIDWSTRSYVQMIFVTPDGVTNALPQIKTGQLSDTKGTAFQVGAYANTKVFFDVSGKTFTKLPWPRFTDPEDAELVDIGSMQYTIVNYMQSVVNINTQDTAPEFIRIIGTVAPGSSDISKYTNKSPDIFDCFRCTSKTDEGDPITNWAELFPDDRILIAEDVTKTKVTANGLSTDGGNFQYELSIDWINLSVQGSGRMSLRVYPVDMMATNQYFEYIMFMDATDLSPNTVQVVPLEVKRTDGNAHLSNLKVSFNDLSKGIAALPHPDWWGSIQNIDIVIENFTSRTITNKPLSTTINRTNFIAPVGTVFPYIGITPPAGCVWWRGGYVTKVELPELYAVIGNRFDLPGDTDPERFRIPDAQGMNLKVRDIRDVGCVDRTVGRDVGHVQAPYIGDHSHKNILIGKVVPQSTGFTVGLASGTVFLNQPYAVGSGPAVGVEAGNVRVNDWNMALDYCLVVSDVRTTADLDFTAYHFDYSSDDNDLTYVDANNTEDGASNYIHGGLGDTFIEALPITIPVDARKTVIELILTGNSHTMGGEEDFGTVKLVLDWVEQKYSGNYSSIFGSGSHGGVGSVQGTISPTTEIIFPEKAVSAFSLEIVYQNEVWTITKLPKWTISTEVSGSVTHYFATNFLTLNGNLVNYGGNTLPVFPPSEGTFKLNQTFIYEDVVYPKGIYAHSEADGWYCIDQHERANLVISGAFTNTLVNGVSYDVWIGGDVTSFAPVLNTHLSSNGCVLNIVNVAQYALAVPTTGMIRTSEALAPFDRLDSRFELCVTPYFGGLLYSSIEILDIKNPFPLEKLEDPTEGLGVRFTILVNGIELPEGINDGGAAVGGPILTLEYANDVPTTKLLLHEAQAHAAVVTMWIESPTGSVSSTFTSSIGGGSTNVLHTNVLKRPYTFTFSIPAGSVECVIGGAIALSQNYYLTHVPTV